jgi:hypothetical protein
VLVEPVVLDVAVEVVTVVVVLEVFVTGVPVPVSVAVVSVAVDWTVSVDPAVLSAGLPPPQALQSETTAMMLRTLRISNLRQTKSNRRARLARDVNAFRAEVQYG